MPKKKAGQKPTISWKKKGVVGGKSMMPYKFRICYPNYHELQKGMSIRKIQELAKKEKPKKDPRIIPPKIIKKKNT